VLSCVKNGLSNLTKVQNGQDQYRNDVGSDCQGKALKELSLNNKGSEGVSLTEKTSTNIRLN